MSDVPNRLSEEEISAIMGDRLNALVEGLPLKEAKEMLEELVDNYLWSHFGFSIIAEIRKVKRKTFSRGVTYQPLNHDKAYLISANGYTVIEHVILPNNRARLILEECPVSNERDCGPGVMVEMPVVPHLQRGGLQSWQRKGKR